ncbi:hypothetical protein F5B19DRAFT_444639 [Rostrohypoxylon terebratum]|nr:hypothetical protein F5B19DRAFT_444639 [Rostrohypoxylon terebratum]
MFSLRQAYEPISTILNPTSSSAVARDTLQNLTFIFLGTNAVVSFALIMATLCTIAGHSKAILGCSIVYVVLFLLTILVGCFLYVRIRYFKSHPIPPTPVGPAGLAVDGNDYLDSHEQPVEPTYQNDARQSSEFRDLELGDIGAQHYEASETYEESHYYPPSSRNSYQQVDEENMTEISLSPMVQDHLDIPYHGSNNESMSNLSNNYARSSREQSSRESLNEVGNRQDMRAPRPVTIQTHEEIYQGNRYSTQNTNRQNYARSVGGAYHPIHQLPFSPSVSQLSGREVGGRQSYETYDEARAALRANWRQENNQ